MKEIIGENGHVFDQQKRPTREMGNIRHKIYHDAYVKYGGPTIIKNYLKEHYNFNVNQATIYYAWYKMREKNKVLTARQYIDLQFGADAYKDRNIERLMYEYMAYHVGLHMTIDLPHRHDIKQKVTDTNKMLDENGYR